jgi:hypothetical protein
MPLNCSAFLNFREPLSGERRNGKVPNKKRFEREKRIGKQLQGKNINILTIE